MKAKKAFSLIECVIYILCLIIILSLLSEMVFKFYMRIHADLKSIQRVTDSVVCLNNLTMDLCKGMARGTIKGMGPDVITLNLEDGDVKWMVRDGCLYRMGKKIEEVAGRVYKYSSLMMRNVSRFGVTKYETDAVEREAPVGFKIQVESELQNLSMVHFIALRRFP